MLCLVLCWSAGCDQFGRSAGSLDRQELLDESVRDAHKAMEEGQYDLAIDQYLRVVYENPLMARPHLDLALLLEGHKKDYVQAIYHYRRYLMLRPQTEKRLMIEERIEQAKRMYAEVCGIHSHTSPEVVEELASWQAKSQNLLAQVTTLSNELIRVEEAFRVLSVEHERALTKIIVEQREKEKLQARLASMDGLSSRNDRADKMLMYTVKPRDNLSRIASLIYGDGSLWPVIQEANAALLGDSVSVQSGQELTIPEPDSPQARTRFDEYRRTHREEGADEQ
jgi:hypothetical protein